jgi:hypothetical protein
MVNDLSVLQRSYFNNQQFNIFKGAPCAPRPPRAPGAPRLNIYSLMIVFNGGIFYANFNLNSPHPALSKGKGSKR